MCDLWSLNSQSTHVGQVDLNCDSYSGIHHVRVSLRSVSSQTSSGEIWGPPLSSFYEILDVSGYKAIKT